MPAVLAKVVSECEGEEIKVIKGFFHLGKLGQRLWIKESVARSVHKRKVHVDVSTKSGEAPRLSTRKIVPRIPYNKTFLLQKSNNEDRLTVLRFSHIFQAAFHIYSSQSCILALVLCHPLYNHSRTPIP